MQLIVDIQNESLVDKIVTILSAFKNDGVEIIHQAEIKNQDELDDFTDEYLEENWKELIMTTNSDSNYHKSEQYKIDRAMDWEERGKI